MASNLWSKIVVLATFAGSVSQSNAANILFFHGISSYSHRIAVWPLVERLVENGHNVSFLSPFPPKNPNPKVREVIPDSDEMRELFAEDAGSLLPKRLDGTYQEVWNELFDFGLIYCELFLKDVGVKEWLAGQETFDLILIDILFNDCAYGLVHKYKAKHILYSTATLFMWHPDLHGSFMETSWIPDLQTHYQQDMTFLERVSNTIRPLYWQGNRCYWYLPKIEQMIRKHMNLPDMPAICELEAETSLMFMNTHFSIEYARSLPPMYIPVGGLHIKEANQELPKDMAKFIDGGDGGFIYISFGSYADMTQLPVESQHTFYDVLRSFPKVRFIWKWNGVSPKEMPENVLTSSWIPQQALLADKRIKGFITHGGLLSIEESTFYGVPIICFPIFGEQDFNAQIIEKTGRGIKLEISSFSKNELQAAISNLLNNDSYKKNMEKTSKLFKDLPATSLETAVWWTEYVLRHEDTSFMKPLGINQTWYQRRLLDVWAFIFGIITVAPLILCYILSKCIHRAKYEAIPKSKKD